MIKRPGENRWFQREERWNEAALGEDAQGRALFIFTRSPITMHDLNNRLLALDLDLVCAQHLEGGSEAQLYVSAGDVELELVGGFQTSFLEGDGSALARPIPNVLGVRRVATPPTPPSEEPGR
jgi:hypothetical protein